MRSAAQPAPCGDAMLVPEATKVPPPLRSERIATPGAKMSVAKLLLVNEAATSWLFAAPTDMTFERHAGAVMPIELLLPADANAMTPSARSLLMTAAPACVNALA